MKEIKDALVKIQAEYNELLLLDSAYWNYARKYNKKLKTLNLKSDHNKIQELKSSLKIESDKWQALNGHLRYLNESIQSLTLIQERMQWCAANKDSL